MTTQPITIVCTGGELRTEPQPKGKRDGKPWHYFAWHCVLFRGARTLDVPDYKCGIAHCETKMVTYVSSYSNHRVRDGWRHATREQATMLKQYGTLLSIYDAENTWYRPTPPTADGVLYSLVMDARCYEDASSFEDFCSDLGYDSDSRTAERVYQACADISKRLRGFLGHELFARALVMDEDALAALCAGREPADEPSAPTAPPDAPAGSVGGLGTAPGDENGDGFGEGAP